MNRPSMVRAASQWVVAFLLVIALTAFFFALVGFQVTSEGTGKRALRSFSLCLLPQVTFGLYMSAVVTPSKEPTVHVEE